MFQCQTYKCTINPNKEGEASLLKKLKTPKKKHSIRCLYSLYLCGTVCALSTVLD